MIKQISACRVCGTSSPTLFFDLGKQPLANSLLDSRTQAEEAYPLALVFCNICGLVQLSHTISPEVLFSTYVWVTGTSSTARAWVETFCKELLARTSESERGYILELASNDGTALRPFQERGFTVLGIDPASNIVEVANKGGVPTRVAFWSRQEAERLREERGPARIVFARHVVPHVADTRDFIRGVRAILADDGVFAIEVHDAEVIQRELHYDSLYHEHLCYFTLEPMIKLLEDAGLYVFDWLAGPISGGALIVYASPTKRRASPALEERRECEKAQGINTLKRWSEFARQSQLHRDALLELVRSAKNAGKRVVGYGASARSSTLLNFAHIDTTLLPVIADLNPMKHGKYTAGTHIPIKKPAEVFEQHPDIILLLGWNFEQEIRTYVKEKSSYSGEYIIPLPGMPRTVS